MPTGPVDVDVGTSTFTPIWKLNTPSDENNANERDAPVREEPIDKRMDNYPHDDYGDTNQKAAPQPRTQHEPDSDSDPRRVKPGLFGILSQRYFEKRDKKPSAPKLL